MVSQGQCPEQRAIKDSTGEHPKLLFLLLRISEEFRKTHCSPNYFVVQTQEVHLELSPSTHSSEAIVPVVLHYFNDRYFSLKQSLVYSLNIDLHTAPGVCELGIFLKKVTFSNKLRDSL